MAEPDATSLAEVLDRVLDKGVVVDVQARVSLVGIEVMTVEGQVVAASLDTYYENRAEIEAVEHGVVDDGGDDEAAAEVVDAASEALDAATDSVESTAEAAGNGLGTTDADGESESSGSGGAVGDSAPDDDSKGDAPGDDEAADDGDEQEPVPEGEVRCRECGEVFEAITPSHLATHDTSIEEYREKHGEDVPMEFGGA